MVITMLAQVYFSAPLDLYVPCTSLCMCSTSIVKFGVCTPPPPPIVHYFHYRLGGGRLLRIRTKIWSVHPCATFVCTHACSYTCIQLHMHAATLAYSYTCMQLPMHTATHAYSYPCIQLPMHTATHANSYPCIQLPMHTATHAYSYPCIQLPMHTATHAYSYTCIQLHMHTATAQTVVYTSMVQTAGWAYTLLQITPLQDLGAEK